MLFTVNGSNLATALNNALRIVGKVPEKFSLRGKANSNTLTICAAGSGRLVTYNFKAHKIVDDFTFSTAVDRLIAISAKRAVLEFNLTNKFSTLEYKALVGAYHGHIEATRSEEFAIAKRPDLDVLMSKQLKTAICSMFKNVSLSPQFVSQDMFLFITVDDNGITTAAGDAYHIALHEVQNEGDKKHVNVENLALPFQYISLITGIFDLKNQEINFYAKDSKILLYNKDIVIQLPLIMPPADGASMERICKHINKGYKEQPVGDFTVDIDDIKLILNNMAGIKDVDSNSDLILNVVGETLQMRMSSKHGAVIDNVPIVNHGKPKASIALEPGTVQDVLDKIEGRCSIRFLGSNICLIEKREKTSLSRYLIVAVSSLKK